MPNIKSAIKRVNVTEKKTAANKMKKSEIRTSVKKAKAAVASGEATPETMKDIQKTLDQAAAKGHISKQAAARTKSRIAKANNANK
ncbi:small subunit ribosomal protein S20 [Ruminococcaceae bacterium YRB3002]|nr:small subunit ribosomal protein S20 [Ruminococcaceae bacterium YRB3002]